MGSKISSNYNSTNSSWKESQVLRCPQEGAMSSFGELGQGEPSVEEGRRAQLHNLLRQ